ncbi:MAG TPA: LuxR C-terminal-related transcriptional regulator [Marmoricola sp.]|nr:LuxR C-terminal-related transcriptional regulator [Nocardioidaceae bacterium]HRV69745.1 LuxR C-terminal-related transcriptional regulator [Marmoricola sp.]
MDRGGAIDEVLRLVSVQHAPKALVILDRLPQQDAFTHALGAFAAFMADDHDELDKRSAAAMAMESEGPIQLLALSTRVLAGAVGRLQSEELDPLLSELESAAVEVSCEDQLTSFAHYVAIEAALGAAQLSLVNRLVEDNAPPEDFWPGHPYVGVIVSCRARAAAFGGQINESLSVVAKERQSGVPAVLVHVAQALGAAYGGQIERARRLIDVVEAAQVDPIDRLGRSVYVLLAHIEAGMSQPQRCARAVSQIGEDADLPHLTVVDRAMLFELLVYAALTADDLVAANDWHLRASALEKHRVAAPAVLRIRARLAIRAGDFADAEGMAKRAVEEVVDEGRVIERSIGQIVLARAQMGAGKISAATRTLIDAVAATERAGQHLLRRAAERELRAARRRLPPTAGEGWAVLSVRETEVAELILSGADNARIAQELHLSTRTISTHVTRILRAFDTSSRIGFLAAVCDQVPIGEPLPVLTTRQEAVVQLLAQGISNDEIGDCLGIRPKSVEKHVSDIMSRWDVETRFAIAHLWWAGASYAQP